MMKGKEKYEGLYTRFNIPKWLKTEAYDLYGREACVLCGSKTSTVLHHIWLPDEPESPYENTKPFELTPLCHSCHRKVELLWGGLMKRALWWLGKKKRAEWKKKRFEKSLHSYFSEREEKLRKDKRVPLH